VVLLAGTRSGCGKSTVILALLAALKKKGLSVQPFKAGPDFIDTGLHSYIAGRTSRNLDLWMCGAGYVKESLAKHSQDADAILIEGVMGLFDGGERSSASLAKTIGAEIVLVIDAYGMAESAGALVRGFNDYLREQAGIALSGVIFNRVSSEKHYERLKDSIKGITEGLGYLPREASFSIPERHLGLTVAEEEPLSREQIGLLTDTALKHLDMEKIIALSRPIISNPLLIPPLTKGGRGGVKFAVASDRAFSFYYEDNFDILRENGAEIIFFSPLKDKSLPPGIDCIYLGGGYPELYAKELSANKGMRVAIREWAEAGKPLYAECGGFLYLSENIHMEEKIFPMCGVFPLNGKMRKGPVLGYREINPSGNSHLKRMSFRGHEFHYSELSMGGEKQGVLYNLFAEGNGAISSALYKRSLASYIHLHLGSNRASVPNLFHFIREGL
jgi:cobyrinic acid a,c-diamide synthase